MDKWRENGSLSQSESSEVYPSITNNTSSSSNRLQNQTWTELIGKNKRQISSGAGGMLILFISGMHISWGIWRVDFSGKWLENIEENEFILSIISWYISATVGTFLGSILLPIWGKKIIYYIGEILMAIGSIVFIIWYDEYPGILTARFLTGLSHGIIYITVVIHLSENSIKKIRGSLLGFISVIKITSLFITSIFYHVGQSRVITSDMILGIIGLILSILSLSLTAIFTVESVPFLIRKGKEDLAIKCMMKCRNEMTETWNIRNSYQEMKIMINEDITENGNIFTNGNLRPLILITLVRLQHQLSNNLPLNVIIISFIELISHRWAAVILLGARFCICILPLFSIDKIGRKLHLTLSGGLSGSCLLLFGVLLASHNFYYITYWLPSVFFIMYQLFVSIGIDPVPDILTAEAFGTSKKHWSIGFTMILEYIFTIGLIILFFKSYITENFIYIVIYVTSLCTIGLTIFLQMKLPETRIMSLRQTRNEFRQQDIVYNRNNRNNAIVSGITDA